jgi:hypothetical protein
MIKLIMSDFIITEQQLHTITKKLISEEKLISTKRKWDSFSNEDKNFIIGIAESLYPKEKFILTEAWWNTIGDIVGFFDPTGVVDLINGLDYIRQGRYFYGLLSMIRIIPIAGDAVSLIMRTSKSGRLFKTVNGAMSIVKNGGSTVEATKILTGASKTSSVLAKLIKSSASWGEKLKKIIDKIPKGRVSRVLLKTIAKWIDLFIGASKQDKTIAKGVVTKPKYVTQKTSSPQEDPFSTMLKSLVS